MSKVAKESRVSKAKNKAVGNTQGAENAQKASLGTETSLSGILRLGPRADGSNPPKMESRWYVVHVYSGHEQKVAQALKQRVESMGLEDKIFESLVPTQKKIEVKSGKKETVTEKIFPGYILVRMILDNQSWLAVRTTQGITAFVGVGDRPTPISDKEVLAIQKFMYQEAPKFKTSFSAGEAVKITDGPFTDFLGTINSIDEARGKLKVFVSIFGRETPVELDFLQVTKL